MSEEALRDAPLAGAEVAPELEPEDEDLGLLRCKTCGLAWTAELFVETGSERLSCPRCSDDGRNRPLVPMGGVERRPLVRGGTVRMTYFYNPRSLEHLGLEEKAVSVRTVQQERRRHALRKAILRSLGVTLGK